MADVQTKALFKYYVPKPRKGAEGEASSDTQADSIAEVKGKKVV